MKGSRKTISVSTALTLLPLLVLLGVPVALFWEYPRFPTKPTGWLFVCTVNIPIFIALLAWEVLVGTPNAKIKSPFIGFSIYRLVQTFFWIAIACIYFYAFDSFFPNLHDVHFGRL